MELTDAFINLGIALGLGLLVGMQRERTGHRLGGVRTFPLITVLGTLSAMLADSVGGWVVGAAMLGVVAAVLIGNIVSRRDEQQQPGITTEVAMLIMFVVGAYLAHGFRAVAVAVGGGTAVLLYAKPVLHSFVTRMGDKDVRAIMQFALITMVILPVLPDREYGPFHVLNPYQIWLMVVLVVGISLGGYVAHKALGQRAGIGLGGLLGGLVSSTATTVSAARRAAGAAGQIAPATLIIMLASGVMYARILAEVAVVAGRFTPQIVPPIAVMLGVSAALALAAGMQVRQAHDGLPAQENPTELKSALFFGAMYAIVLLAVAAAREYLPRQGIYAVAAISGLTDMDAITLSVSRMTTEQQLTASIAWRTILVASVANMAFKCGIVAVLGGRALLKRVATYYGLAAAAAIIIIALWPAESPS